MDLNRRGLDWLIALTQWLRALGYIVVTVAMAFTHAASDWGAMTWLSLVFTGLVYPQLIWRWTRTRKDRLTAIHQSMTADFAMCGVWSAAVNWALWPVFAMVTCATLSTILVSGPLRYLRGLALYVVVGVLASLALASQLETRTSPPGVVLVCALGVWLYASVLVAEGYRRAVEMRKLRRQLKQSNTELARLAAQLRKYLPDAVYQIFFTGAGSTARETQRVELTVLFADIVNFTTISDQQPPEQLARDLNRYLACVSSVAEEQGGTVDKFIGDAILVLFGAPNSAGPEEDARRALLAGLAMQAEAKRLREAYPNAPLLSQLHIRVGVHSGPCSVGNFGAENRLDYTAVGRTVNIASRLEAAAQPGDVLCSRPTLDRAVPRHSQERGAVYLRGISEPIDTATVYQV